MATAPAAHSRSGTDGSPPQGGQEPSAQLAHACPVAHRLLTMKRAAVARRLEHAERHLSVIEPPVQRARDHASTLRSELAAIEHELRIFTAPTRSAAR